MTTPKVTRMVFSYGQPRKKPKEGDTKVVKGIKYVRKQVIYHDYNGKAIGYAVSRSGPIFEWIEVGPVVTPQST